MNYYIVTNEVFDTLNKSNVSFMLKSIDQTQILIATTDEVTDRIRKFQSITTCSNYTFTNHSSWTGDGTGVTEEDINDMIYIEELE
tara:strand:+ start:1295 stop:1552 length:258 start_codon:yes stop_codon:yes gene_type:complete